MILLISVESLSPASWSLLFFHCWLGHSATTLNANLIISKAAWDFNIVILGTKGCVQYCTSEFHENNTYRKGIYFCLLHHIKTNSVVKILPSDKYLGICSQLEPIRVWWRIILLGRYQERKLLVEVFFF